MAESPAHRFGQIVGEVLEAAVQPLLAGFAEKHGLYFDKQGDRSARSGKKCRWLDLNKNAHDLDFVLERGGTHAKLGIPAAFVETAWRRYTKHSRNKAQEIQGAIAPLAETYKNARPFVGVILAGVFTEGALTQLRSLGFCVLYFTYDSVIAAFKTFGIDALFDEQTPDSEFAQKVKAYERLSINQRGSLASKLIKSQNADVQKFMKALEAVVLRQIDRIIVVPLHGISKEAQTVAEAIKFIETYKESSEDQPIVRYEIQIRYNNGDAINATYSAKTDAIQFLKSYLPVIPKKS